MPSQASLPPAADASARGNQHRFEPTGFFRVEERGRLWLVTPEGRPFWSFGCGWMDSWEVSQPGRQHSGVCDAFGRRHEPLRSAMAAFAAKLPAAARAYRGEQTGSLPGGIAPRACN